MTKQISMTQVKQTPGAIRYQEVDSSSRKPITQSDPDCIVGTLYIRKTAFQGESIPTDITVTIEE